MIRIIIAAFISTFLLTSCSKPIYVDSLREAKVSYAELELIDAARQRTLSTKVWYPADQFAVEKTHIYDDGFVGFVAERTSIPNDKKHPLVLLSHGTGGSNSNMSWLAEILASNGFIVAAPNHWGNTTGNNLPSGIVRLWDRPQDLSFVIDDLLSDSTWSTLIDEKRIYAAGFSAGGYAVLALAGAEYSPEKIDEFCRLNPYDGVCKVVDDIDFSEIDFSGAAEDYSDHRVISVLAMAPAVGKAITEKSLENIFIPVKIVAAIDDEMVDVETNARLYANNISTASLYLFDEGGHFVFMQECSAIAKMIVWLTVEEDICGFKSQADRRKIQHQTASLALKTFRSNNESHNKRMQPTSG